MQKEKHQYGVGPETERSVTCGNCRQMKICTFTRISGRDPLYPDWYCKKCVKDNPYRVVGP